RWLLQSWSHRKRSANMVAFAASAIWSCWRVDGKNKEHRDDRSGKVNFAALHATVYCFVNLHCPSLSQSAPPSGASGQWGAGNEVSGGRIGAVKGRKTQLPAGSCQGLRTIHAGRPNGARLPGG